MDILMKSPIVKVVGIKKKTKAQFFKDLVVGSRLSFQIPLVAPGISGGSSKGGTYATYITVTNEDTGEEDVRSFNDLGHRLEIFEIEPE